MKIRRTFTKQQLCIIFGLHSPSYQTFYYRRLRNEYFTDEVLTKIGMTPTDYSEVNRNRRFTYLQSLKIIEVFQIEPEELEACV